jgi:ornithine cyclodeaminase/alanine dehydrogenase-like protein (mu-crystallin family)
MGNVVLRFLSQTDVLALNLDFDSVLAVTEKAVQEHARKAFEMPPKPGVHPAPGTFIHAMPAYLPNLGAAGLKWISGFPENAEKGLPMIVGMLVLNDPETGLPICLMDATWITAVRTAAVSTLAAGCFLQKNFRSLGIIGAGTQGTYHTKMLKHVFPAIREVSVFDTSKTQLEIFRANMQESHKLAVTSASDPKPVFEESDLVITATSRQQAPVVGKSWLKQGGVYIGLESFRYWREEALLSADKFVTDDWKQAQSFLKDTKHIKKAPKLYAELGEIVTGAKPGRESTQERIVCIFVGMALVDIALGNMIYKTAMENGIGKDLTLAQF